MERDHCSAGKSALLVRLLCLRARNEAHQAWFAPASLFQSPSLWLEELGNICVALKGPSSWVVARGWKGDVFQDRR